MSSPSPAVSFKSYGGSAPENYERYFVPTIGTSFATALLEHADVRRGERVLDVACGTGIVTRLAAERVGPDGSVAGLDINPGMLAVARMAVPDPSIDWHEANAESIPTGDGSFDVVLCSLGLQFVPDKPAALREMHRVLASDGRVAIGTVAPDAVFDVLEQALARHLSPEVAAFMGAVFSLGDHEALSELIAGAGFADARVETKTLTVRLPEPAEFLWQYASSTPLSAAVSKLDDDAREALERDVVAGWQSFVDDGSLIYEPAVLLSTGRRT
jgi:ubiquinone/menaquinone biosynthesis C-methylase UbiE